MSKKIVLAGNPNSGKTSLFNELTGANQYVGNWPGVTVEKKSGHLRDHEEVELQDLPGIYSLSPYTPEEVVSRRYLLEQKPDLIVNVVDATNMERNLYLTSQLLETGIPVIIALNMMDLVEQRGDSIAPAALSEALGCPVVCVSALRQKGLDELIELMLAPIPAPGKPLSFAPAVETAIAAIAEACGTDRWHSVKLLENDSEETRNLPAEQKAVADRERLTAEHALDDDIASLIAGGRYDAILSFMPLVLKRAKAGDSFSDKLDSVLTHRVFGLFIFVAVMWAVYGISIGTVGTWGTDWANDVLFGEVVSGWLGGFIGDTPAAVESMVQFSAVLAMVLIFPAMLRRLHDIGLNGSWLYFVIAPFLLEYMCPHLPEPIQGIVMAALYTLNAFILLGCIFFPGREGTNKYGTHPAGIRLNGLSLDGRGSRREFVLWFVLLSAVSFGAGLLGTACLDCSVQLQALVNDGIVAGVGAVLGFLPQMAVLFLLLSLLEDCGYMARVAFMMDRIFRSIGLSGKSFIPLMVGMGCGVPGVMATRTIENEKDRRMTVMLTTFVPCGAKLPIIALFGALLGQNAGIATLAYFAGIGSVILGALILRKTRMFAGGYTPFVMELPAYHMPSGTNINMRAMERCQAFVKKAGTIIFLASAAVWFTSNYDWKLNFLNTAEQEEAVENSMLATVGSALAPAFSPLGWGDWKPAVTTITGLIAKENVVGTMGVLYGTGEDAPEAPAEEAEAPAEESMAQSPSLPKCNAFSALVMAAWQFDERVRTFTAPTEEADEEEEDEDAEAHGVAKAVAQAGVFTAPAALGFMLFNLLCAPCFAACGAIRREMNNAKWFWFAIGYMTLWAYCVSFLVYQFGTWMTAGTFGTGQTVAIIVAIILLWQLVRPNPNKNRI